MTGHSFPDERVEAEVRRQWEELEAGLRGSAPTLAAGFAAWVPQVMGDPPWTAFLAAPSYPLVHLPIWAAPSLSTEALASITRSTISGYLFVRLTDNVVDADTDGDELTLLPLGAYLHAEFQYSYQRLLPVESPFWEVFRTAWTAAAEAATADRLLDLPDLQAFERVSAHKTAGAIIPVAAALAVTDAWNELEGWKGFVQSFGRFHQLENDFFGWRKDRLYHNPNLLLSQAALRGLEPDEWFLQEGFEWGAELLMRYAAQVVVGATALASPPLIAYLEVRFGALSSRLAGLRTGIIETARLARLLGVTESSRGV